MNSPSGNPTVSDQSVATLSPVDSAMAPPSTGTDAAR